MKSRIGLIAAAAALLAMVTGPVSAQDIRIVVVSHGQASDPFWSVVKNGVGCQIFHLDAHVFGQLFSDIDFKTDEVAIFALY